MTLHLLAIAFRNLLRARRRNALAGGSMALGTAGTWPGQEIKAARARFVRGPARPPEPPRLVQLTSFRA
jgi:hypothetical protein